MLTMIGQANAQKIITFDAPGAGTGSGQGTGCFAYTDCSVLINNWGAITGYYLDANNVFQGFLRSPEGKFTTFDSPGADTTPGDGNGTFPNAINDAGAITGVYYGVNNVGHGFLRSPEGAFTTFDPRGSLGTIPIALNLEGAVVGYYANQKGVIRAFLRRPDGTFETWSAPGAQATGAYNINIFGQIVGHYRDNNSVTHGLVRSPQGKLTTFDALGAGTASGQGTECPGCAVGFNLFGAAAGLYIDGTNVVHGFLRSPVGEITTFDPPDESALYGLGCYNDCAIGLNDWGAITSSYLDANIVYHGFLRSPEGTFIAFDAPGADTTPGDGNGTFPYSINDQGAITGYYIDAKNVNHGFLLLP
ncbi:MAG: hypothetical protein ACLQGN_30250 [Mycobacterium sp.]|uniref:hypothetical protein n=1 Tax=Mycobacterium sp. TaxID=1785 RepID=UPI003F98FAF7